MKKRIKSCTADETNSSSSKVCRITRSQCCNQTSDRVSSKKRRGSKM
jgi:hypothetical protein